MSKRKQLLKELSEVEDRLRDASTQFMSKGTNAVLFHELVDQKDELEKAIKALGN
jgi:hypothetical protein